MCFDVRVGPQCLRPVDSLPAVTASDVRLGFSSASTLVVVVGDEARQETFLVHPGPTPAVALRGGGPVAAFTAVAPGRAPCSSSGQRVGHRGGALTLLPCRPSSTACGSRLSHRPRPLGLTVRLTLEAGHHQGRRWDLTTSATTTTSATFFGAAVRVGIDPLRWRRNARALATTRRMMRLCRGTP